MSVIKNSDVESIRSVGKAVKVYAEDIKKDIDKLLKHHDDMGGVWSGKQYDELSDVLIETQKEISKQSAILLEIAEQIKIDADKLEKAKNTKIK